MVTALDKYSQLKDNLCLGLAGDAAAYAQFLQAITPILRRVAARKIAVSDVEDVVQEILLSVHKARHTYDGQRPIMPWLVAIANFRISDYLRKYYAQMRNQMVDISELEEFLADVTETSEDNESVIELLQDVPQKQRDILTMLHVDGYTSKEIGEKLNMNESAVKVAAHRAIKKIREKFVG